MKSQYEGEMRRGKHENPEMANSHPQDSCSGPLSLRPVFVRSAGVTLAFPIGASVRGFLSEFKFF
jgi:hypothetical protein